MLSRRTVHALAAGAAATVAYLAAAEAGSRRPVRVGGLLLLSTGALAGLVTSKASAKAQAVETRLNTHIAATADAVNLVANGGTIGGNVTVQGDHHVQGTLYGSGGTLSVGDHIDSSQPISTSQWLGVDGNITMLGHINGVGNLTRLSTPVTDSNFSQENSTENTNRGRVNAMMDGL